jgi:hypothetical protein
MKTDPPPGPSRKDHLAQTPASKGFTRKSLTGILMVVEIHIAPAEVSSSCSVRRSPLLKENENT